MFVGVEVVGGLLAGSLALLADAGHMASDAAALAFSLLAVRAARRPANARMTYGYKRVETLAAFVNSGVLLAVCAGILIQAVIRSISPHPVQGGTMLWVAFAGLAANLVAFLILHEKDNHHDLNMRSAWLHVLSDMAGFVAAMVAAGIIMLTGWNILDPLLSIVVTLFMVRGAWQILRTSAHILIEGAPLGLDTDGIRHDLMTHVADVDDVHHIHAWSMSSNQTLLTLHVRHAADAAPSQVIDRVKVRLSKKFSIDHVTVQTELETCPDNHGDSACHGVGFH